MKNFESEFGLKTSMTHEKIEHLEGMGFQWSVKKEGEDTMWNQRYEELRAFKERHGHCRVPQRSSGKLGKWVQNQKFHKRIIAGRTEGRVVKLETIGFFDA